MKSFLNHDKSILTSMVQGDNPERVIELMDMSMAEGAEAFGMQFCRMKKEFKNPETYKRLFNYTHLPVYVTNYRYWDNAGLTDDELAKGLVELAECGATLCDVMGDYFDKQPDEMARDEEAIDKQMRLIDTLHEKGAEVLISSHVLKFTPAERVLEIALEHERRGADISKIVVGADNMEEEIENFRIMNLLKQNLKIPFLFLSGGECHLIRRVGGELGSCMYLCVHEYDSFATATQPLLKKVKAIRDNMR